MRKVILLSVLLISYSVMLHAQDDDSLKYVEVTGSSEIEVDPDEIHLIIQIQEYWEEEYQDNTQPEQYKTKVPIDNIEKDLMATLQNIGVASSNIHVWEIGNYWRQTGKDFLVSKEFDLKLDNFKIVDTIIKNINHKGINALHFGELKNKDQATYRKLGKIEALKAAKVKATYLVDCMGKQLGDILRIIEPEEQGNHFMPAQASFSNAAFASPGDPNSTALRKIKYKYEMKARFEIK
ncbi:SIMPL domain-containing protein [Bacteroides bouchesdurhonensis]